MCIACESNLSLDTRDQFANRLLGMINDSATILLISLGHRSGLFDAMADGARLTSQQLADRAGLDERYVREWLGGMVASRIVERDPAANTHRLPPEHAHSLCRATPTANMAVFSQYIGELGSVESRVLDCFRNGGGVAYEEFPRFHDVMEEDSGQAIVPIIVDKVVPMIDGLHDRLVAGIDVIDIGCGRGRALRELARAYPNSRFRGIDLSPDAIAIARAYAAEMGLTNLAFEVRDLTHWSEPASADWITALDAIHDQGRPDLVLRAVRQALRPGGVFFMLDIDASSEPVDNIAHPLGALLYTVSTMHCMTVSLAQGGMGLGTCWGTQLATRMLNEAGFTSVDIHRLEHDVQNAYYIARP